MSVTFFFDNQPFALNAPQRREVRRAFRRWKTGIGAHARIDGYNDSVGGLPVQMCPYEEGDERQAWLDGWEMATRLGLQIELPRVDAGQLQEVA